MALGKVPGLKIDRTGIALLGAIAMVSTGIVQFSEVCKAIDLSTISLLYALMIISAQLRLGGFYTWSALLCTKILYRPRWFLLAVMLLSAFLSAFLANDIVCLAFTPVLAASLRAGGLNPVPFLLGLAIASNIGSAATIIGNPQNMLIGQMGKLDFKTFSLWAVVPSCLALTGAFGYICLSYKREFSKKVKEFKWVEDKKNWPDFNQWESLKGILATGVVVFLFFTDIPRELSALSIAGFLLLSRKMYSRDILGLIDWHLLTLFASLFIVIYGVTSGNYLMLGMEYIKQYGLDLQNLGVLTFISTLLSNLVSNVPAVMILVNFLDPTNPEGWYVLALSSTFAGNLILIGSIANLIVVEQAKLYDIEISFKEHARIGIPITLISLVILLIWIVI